jgi:hypothetical protein
VSASTLQHFLDRGGGSEFFGSSDLSGHYLRLSELGFTFWYTRMENSGRSSQENFILGCWRPSDLY